MAKTWAKAPSPCIGVCKFRLEGQCVGCGMTKPERKSFKRRMKKADRKLLFRRLLERLQGAGRLDYWTRMYRRKCTRKEVDCPLDKLKASAGTDGTVPNDDGRR